jgi:hypothetical protein
LLYRSSSRESREVSIESKLRRNKAKRKKAIKANQMKEKKAKRDYCDIIFESLELLNATRLSGTDSRGLLAGALPLRKSL